MAEHTPGPWKAEHHRGRWWVSARGRRQRVPVADVTDVEVAAGPGEVDTDDDATAANAALLAAAPALLAALEGLLRETDDGRHGCDRPAARRARAAVRKARAR